MRVVVDSSVWIAYLRREDTPHTRALRSFAKESRIVVPDLVLLEVLQGSRNDHIFRIARSDLMQFPQLTTVDQQVVSVAARNYQSLRELGITVRSTVDTLIATRCILDGCELLHRDRDFEPFAQHLGLKVTRVPDPS